MKSNKIENIDTKNNESLPVRTCLACRDKKEKKNLFRISKFENKYIFDATNKIQARGVYICKKISCIEKFSKNKKYNIEKEELIKMIDIIKKNKKENQINFYIDIKKCVFGIKIVREKVWNKEVKLTVIASDITEKNMDKIINDCKQKAVKYVVSENKERLGRIFGKNEISVIGILDENLANSLMKSLGGVPVEST